MHFFKRNNMLKIILFSIWKIQIRLKKGGWGGNQTERRVRSNFMFWNRGFKFLLRANMIEQVLVFYPVNSTFRDPHWCTVWYLSQFSPTWVCYSDFTLSAHVLCLLQPVIMKTSWTAEERCYLLPALGLPRSLWFQRSGAFPADCLDTRFTQHLANVWPLTDKASLKLCHYFVWLLT